MAQLLFIFSCIGLMITYMEREVIIETYKDKPGLALGRLLVLNLPLVVYINFFLRGWL